MVKWIGIAVVGLAAIVVAGPLYYAYVMNPKVEQELRDDPDGERARKVMLITLPSGRTLPVNYLREGDTVYAGADGSWWKELRGDGGRGEVLVRGETLAAHMRAVEDDPELRDSVFARLRPTAPRWTGTLVVVELDTGER